MSSRNAFSFLIVTSLLIASTSKAEATEQAEWFSLRLPAQEALWMLSDTGIEKELRIGRQQREVLDELRMQYFAAYSQMAIDIPRPNASPDESRAASETMLAQTKEVEDEFRPKILEALTVRQRERFRQIVWQARMIESLLAEPSVTKAIGITVEQEEKLREVLRRARRTGEDATEAPTSVEEQTFQVLTAAQEERWRELTGPKIEIESLRDRLASQDRSLRGTHAPEWFGNRRVIEVLSWLTNDLIAQELLVTEEQIVAFEDMLQEVRLRQGRARSTDRPATTATAEERAKFYENLRYVERAIEDEFRPQVWKSLSVAQRERLRQIIRQLDVAKAFEDDAVVVSRMRLTKDQRKAIQVTQREHRLEESEIRQGGLQGEARFERVEAARVKKDKKIVEVLTEEQRKRWLELVGKPVDIAAIHYSLSPYARATNLPESKVDGWFDEDAKTFSVLQLIRSGRVISDLMLTAHQQERLAKLQDESDELQRRLRNSLVEQQATHQERIASSEKYFKESAAIEAELRPKILATLTESQRNRLRQIYWQWNVPTTLLRNAEVVNVVQTTSEQVASIKRLLDQFIATLQVLGRDGLEGDEFRSRVEASQEELNKKVLKVLTEEQLSQWKELTGAPFEGLSEE